MNFLYILQQSFFQGRFFFFHEIFHLFLQTGILFKIFADSNSQVRSVVEECLQIAERILDSIQHFFYTCTCVSFDVSCCGYVCTSTKLNRRTELNHTYSVTVFFAEKSDSTQLFCFFDRNVTIFLQRNIGTDSCINDVFHLADFFVCHLLEVREVETQ